MDDSDFLRYSRQLMLEEINYQGQHQLQRAHVLIVGLGGLGSPAALYLAAAGVGTLSLADDDRLDLTNLSRQILYRTADIGQSKAKRASAHLHQLNPQITIRVINNRLTEENLAKVVKDVDLVLDCSDNLPTRYHINSACISAQKTLISGSAIGFNGQLLVIEPPYRYGCYACLYPNQKIAPNNCRTAGVLGPVVGVIGTLQALEAIKILAGLPSALSGKLGLFNGKKNSWRHLQLNRSTHCAVCGVIKQPGEK
ncbi:thiamin (thiazole moiety) biosynthesis protein [Candidatus Regiella insecticola LSR1]|uniref:Thiamin (Thiazole moiety) biosynthesis protein n=1 Tax=Candidatus Regiella insecticola LSR1 TaxID=663321 RepID=E0WV57_9ENTR|nr:HesA/MoeB/ThiF family protein [Candidatus Regiella insecticola]EFL91107.1 thiamin (thiazole moiety) biosynthesis protein [Candidatus Regiella insecticola LSR1]